MTLAPLESVQGAVVDDSGGEASDSVGELDNMERTVNG
jgi:hypothetical protein